MKQFSAVDADYERSYLTEVLKSRMFGAFIEAVKFRRDTDGMNQKRFADLLGTTDTNVSKMVAGPRNWQLSTIAEFLHALDLEIEFAFVDKRDKNHIFTDAGAKYRDWLGEQLFARMTQIYADNLQMTTTIQNLHSDAKPSSFLVENQNISENAVSSNQLLSIEAGNFIYDIER